MCSKGDLGKIPEPKEPNESVQTDFWGPINCLKEFKKYVRMAVDRFSRWPSAMVCNSNRSAKIVKFLRSYINAHGVPRQIRVDQGTNFMSNSVTKKGLKYSPRQLTIIEQQGASNLPSAVS